MRCRACGAETRLMEVFVGDALRWTPSIERQIFKCSACPHVTRRLVFGALPISTGGAITHPQTDVIRVPTQSPSEAQLAAKLSSNQPRHVSATAKASTWARGEAPPQTGGSQGA